MPTPRVRWRFRFAAVAIVASDSTRSAATSFRDTVAPMYATDSRDNWQRAGELSAAFLLNYDEVPRVHRPYPGPDRSDAAPRLCLHAAIQDEKPVLVLSGRDAAAVSDAIKQLRPSEA